MGLPEHPTGTDLADPALRQATQPKAGGSTGFGASKMLMLAPGLRWSLLSISPGRKRGLQRLPTSQRSPRALNPTSTGPGWSP